MFSHYQKPNEELKRVCEINYQTLYIFTKASETACVFSCRFLKAGADEIREEDRTILMDYRQEMAKNLKEYCEKLEVSAFQ